MLSIIMTAYNEGDEVKRTIASIRESIRSSYEIIVVDDASTDGSCETIEADDVRVLRHTARTGIAYSRNQGSAAARGDVLAFLDAHHRLSPGCLDECAAVAQQYGAVVYPEVRGLQDQGWTGHGAFLRLCPKRGYFVADWNRRVPRDKLSRISMMVVPGYVMPRSVYDRIFWIRALRGWGASEPAICIKAFFQDIDLLHLCGPLARHMFRNDKKIPYTTPWDSIWRNHALVARVCFDERTWNEHWLPEVFDKHLSAEIKAELDGPDVRAEHEAFQALKVRSDREFWRGLLHREEPACLRP